MDAWLGAVGGSSGVFTFPGFLSRPLASPHRPQSLWEVIWLRTGIDRCWSLGWGAGPQAASFSESILMIHVKCYCHQITLPTKFWRDRWCDRLELETDFTNIVCVIHCNWRFNCETEPRVHRKGELGDTWCLRKTYLNFTCIMSFSPDNSQSV